MVKGGGVIYLQRDRFQIFTTLQPVVANFPFVNEIVRDLDVVNGEIFANILKVFIESNKILPCNFTIVLADNVCFIKDFPSNSTPPEAGATPEQIREQKKAEKKELEKGEKDFVEHVPFEKVASKSFPIQNGERVFATNQELFDLIKNSFESQGSSVEAVIPGEIFGNNLGTLSALTSEAAALVFQMTPNLKQYNLLVQQFTEPEEVEKKGEFEVAESQPVLPAKNDHKREIMLGAIFGVLVIVLIVVYFMSNQKPTKTQSQASTPVSNVQTVPQ